MCSSQVVWVSRSSSELDLVHGNQGSSVNKRRASRNEKQRARVKRRFDTITKYNECFECCFNAPYKFDNH